jgi:hypothetical protein
MASAVELFPNSFNKAALHNKVTRQMNGKTIMNTWKSVLSGGSCKEPISFL